MNKVLLFVLFALFAAALVSAHGGHEKTPEEKAAEEALFNPPNSDVITATAETIDEVLGKTEFALVEFYAPWCPHCKQLVPTYEKVATALKDKVTIAKVDCDKHREVAQKYNVPGFPTIKLFKNGKAFKDFEEADRSVEGILRWIEKKTGPAATTLASEADVADFVKKQTDNGVTSAVVVGTFPSKEDEAYKTFLATADSVDDFVFAEVIAEGKPAQVKLYKAHQGEEDVTVGEEALKSAEALTAEVKANGYSLVDEVNGKTFQRYAASKLPLGVLFFDYTKADQKESGMAVLRPAAKALRGKFNFGYSDAAIYGEQYAIMGGDKTKLPGLAAMNLETRKNFPYTGELNAEAVTAWANEILAGKIQPFMRSEPVPEKNDEPVKVVVGKSYEQIVMDETKDVLLEFYAPWCGHCQKLAPKYEQLAEFFAPVKDLVIAKIDSTQNDTPVSVEGFPTIYYFPADAKDEPIQYEGNRSIQDLKKFIKKNASDRISSQVKDLLKSEKGADKKKDKKSKDEL